MSATDAFFAALATNTAPMTLLTYFSSTYLVIIQHAPSTCPYPKSSRLTGLNAIRSYFDLLATHWTRSDMQKHSVQANTTDRTVVVKASVTWMWKKSRRSWREEFTCTLGYDEHCKIVSFIVRTESGPGTCIMRAVDIEPPVLTKPMVPLMVSLTYDRQPHGFDADSPSLSADATMTLAAYLTPSFIPSRASNLLYQIRTRPRSHPPRRGPKASTPVYTPANVPDIQFLVVNIPISSVDVFYLYRVVFREPHSRR